VQVRQTWKLLLLQTWQPTWQGTQLPLIRTDPDVQSEHVKVLFEPAEQEEQYVPHPPLVRLDEATQLLLVVRVNPTAQDVQEVGVPGLQVAQLLLQS